MPGSGRHRPDEVRRLLERAAQIQADDEGAAAGEVTTAELEAAAEQAGISSSALRRALAEARGVNLEAARRHRETRRFGSRIEHRLHVAAPAPEGVVDRIWDIAIRERGDLGAVEQVGNSRVWRPRRDRGDGFEVGVRTGADATEVWIHREARGSPGRGWIILLALAAGFVLGFRSMAGLFMGAVFAGGWLWFDRRRALQRSERRLARIADAIEAELVESR